MLGYRWEDTQWRSTPWRQKPKPSLPLPSPKRQAHCFLSSFVISAPWAGCAGGGKEFRLFLRALAHVQQAWLSKWRPRFELGGKAKEGGVERPKPSYRLYQPGYVKNRSCSATGKRKIRSWHCLEKGWKSSQRGQYYPFHLQRQGGSSSEPHQNLRTLRETRTPVSISSSKVSACQSFRWEWLRTLHLFEVWL